MSPQTALIFGISGQDGAFLAQHLLASGWVVHGASRDREMANFGNLRRLGIYERVRLHSAVITDFRSVLQLLNELRPAFVFNLAGQSSVGLSFSQPVDTLDSVTFGTINILEAMRFLKLDARFYNAASSECFGNTEQPADELTAFRPRSPYGVGKAAAFWAVANYRESYELFACSGILFNHESPLRPARFVTQKIIVGAADIAAGISDRLELGNLSIARDWGWAPEYVDAMTRMLLTEQPEDFVIATGQRHTLQEFCEEAFRFFGLNWRQHVEVNEYLLRPSDIALSIGNPSKAARVLGWRAQTHMPEIVRLLANAELERRAQTRRDGQ